MPTLVRVAFVVSLVSFGVWALFLNAKSEEPQQVVVSPTPVVVVQPEKAHVEVVQAEMQTNDGERTHAVVAPTISAPLQTVAGVIGEQLSELGWGKGSWTIVQSPLKSVDSVLTDSTCNPKGKLVSSAAYRELAVLVEAYSKEAGPVYERAGQLKQDGLLRAVQQGRFVCNATKVPNVLEPAETRRAMAEGLQQSSSMRQDLEARIGLPATEWRWAETTATGPDGKPIRALSWFTRREEPDYFATYEQFLALTDQHRERLRAFFERQP